MQRTHEKELESWKQLVGGFMLAFGEIELLTYRLWAHCFPDRNIVKQFSDRTGKIIGKLKEVGGKEDLIDLLVQANVLSEKRNTVAHNPMQVQVYQHSKTGDLISRMAITSPVNDDYIDDLELEELQADAERIVTEFYKIIGFHLEEPSVI
jgi:hypothetical protein